MNAPIDHIAILKARLSKGDMKRLKAMARERLAGIEADRDREAAEAAAWAARTDAEVIKLEAWRAAEMAKCAADIVYWCNTYVYTYNPKLAGRRNPDGTKVNPYLRFTLFPKQIEFLKWLEDRIRGEEQGLCEKSRDVGVSYLCGLKALHLWLFEPGSTCTFGSYVKEKVDSLGDPSAIMPKIRIMRDRLPGWMLPTGFDRRHHDNQFKIVNPSNEAIITGEGGKNMGRGGRATFFMLDEAAHVENAEDVEAALSGTTDCVIYVSSVNGVGNLFYRKRHGGEGEAGSLSPEQIFTLHYRDDPRKDAAWIKKKKGETTPIKWAQEYEIDYSASLEGVCIKAKHVRAAQALHRMWRAGEIQYDAPEQPITGLDVGAGGKGKSIAISRAGPVVYRPKSRREADTTGTAIWGYDCAQAHKSAHLNYDAPGVGAGVTSTFKHVKRPGITVHAINTGSDPFVVTGKWDDGRRSDELFVNLKAEIWWIGRTRFEKAYQLWLHLNPHEEDDEGVEGRPWPLSECFMLPSGDPESDTLAVQLSMIKVNVKEDGRLIMEKKTELAKRGVASPDAADALMLSLIIRRKAYDISALAAGVTLQNAEM